MFQLFTQNNENIELCRLGKNPNPNWQVFNNQPPWWIRAELSFDEDQESDWLAKKTSFADWLRICGFTGHTTDIVVERSPEYEWKRIREKMAECRGTYEFYHKRNHFKRKAFKWSEEKRRACPPDLQWVLQGR